MSAGSDGSRQTSRGIAPGNAPLRASSPSTLPATEPARASDTASTRKSVARLRTEHDLLVQLRDAQTAVFEAVRDAAPVAEVSRRVEVQARTLQSVRAVLQSAVDANEAPASEAQAAAWRSQIQTVREDIRASARRAQHLCKKTSSWVEGQIHWLVDWAERQQQGATYGPSPAAARESSLSARLDRSV